MKQMNFGLLKWTMMAVLTVLSSIGVAQNKMVSAKGTRVAQNSRAQIAQNLRTNDALAQPVMSERLVLKKSKKDLTVPFGVEYGTNLNQQNDVDKKEGLSLSLKPSYKINDSFTVLSEVVFNQDLTGPKNSSLDNTVLGGSYKKKINDRISWKSALFGILPTDENLRKNTSFQGAAKGFTGLEFPNAFLGTNVSYSLSYTRNFHGYSQTNTGSFNIRESVTNSLSLDVPFLQKYAFFTSFGYQTAWNYADTQYYKFLAAAGFGYQTTKTISLSLATVNEGNALKPNGTDSNIELFNDRSSLVILGMTYLL